MDRQRRSRYVLAVYLVVLSLAVVLVLAGLFFTTNPDWKAVWINLGTGLLGVVVLFFLVQRFFLVGEGAMPFPNSGGCCILPVIGLSHKEHSP